MKMRMFIIKLLGGIDSKVAAALQGQLSKKTLTLSLLCEKVEALEKLVIRYEEKSKKDSINDSGKQG